MSELSEQERYESIDLPFYHREVAPYLPPAIIDFHSHTWSADDWKIKPWDDPALPGGRYMVSDAQYPPRQLLADGRRCFPDRPYQAVVFGYPTPAADWEKDTAFVARAAAAHRELFPLVLAGRELDLKRQRYGQVLDSHGFFGFKVFLNWFGDDYGQKNVQDMLGPEEMELAQERRLIVLLHVPGADRLADPQIQQGVAWLARQCPGASIVLAHCGRCYLPQQMKAALPAIASLPNVYLDTSMVMDPVVIQLALQALGPQRLLFGTDFPPAAMRGRRVRVMDHWVDVVLPGYPDSGYRVASAGIRATFMVWEIALAIRWAVELQGLGQDALHGIFYNNARTLLQQVDQGRAWNQRQSQG